MLSLLIALPKYYTFWFPHIMFTTMSFLVHSEIHEK